ncbi:hypothetical protein GC176_05115 [bacterium]|nr:hypothetical protein [bacterium]
MPASADNSDRHFLDHPEIQPLFESALTTLVSESDRGAVLIGAAHVDEFLRTVFERLAPKSMSRAQSKRILDYPGPLSSLSAKADIAFTTRLISANVYEAIGHLRKIRNHAAHSSGEFKLADYDDEIRKMYAAIGPTVPLGVNHLANELLVRSAVARILEIKNPFSDDGSTVFNDPMEVIDHLSEHPELTAKLDERRPRFEFALGLVFACAVLVLERDSASKLLKDNVTLGSFAATRSKTKAS